MTLLGGLFQKRVVHKTASVASDSTDGDYVFPDRPPPPVYNIPAAASSNSRLKLPFRRKPPVADPPPTVMSDSGHDLPPPPRKSSLFAIHNNSHPSVHSLPTSPHVHPDTPSRPSSLDVLPETPTNHAHKRSQGLFTWARERTKSKPLPPSSAVSSVAPATADSSSFNLKSFRHVGADSPITYSERLPSASFLPPPRPRPRGDSVASDSSQRMSIAAFREAQARSRANSPVPCSRLSSTADTLRVDGPARKRASTVSVVSATECPQPNQTVTPAPMPNLRPDSSAMDTSSDESDSEDDEEVDSDGQPLRNPARKQAVTRRIDGIRPRSDAGHGPVTTSNDQPSQDSPKLSTPLPMTHHSDQAPFIRSRASASTSALKPSTAARTASILAATNSSSSSQARSKPPPPKPKDDSDESTDYSDADSEDMPLRDLVAPRRPGSSASNMSNGRPRMPGKPLIDINSLTGGPPLLTPILRHENSVKNLNTRHKGQDVEKDQPFSVPAVLALSSSVSPPISPSISKPVSTPPGKPVPALHHRKPSNDVPALAKSEGLDNDDDLVNAIRLVGVLDKEQEEQTSEPSKPSGRIVPTPIRAREPLTSFTVLSRPAQRQSATETSASTSPISSQAPSNSTTTSPTLSPRSDRQRGPTATKSTAQNDKSDTLSITSAPRSTTSRTVARIPPIPHIQTMPDVSSVKEDYKPGRPRAVSTANTNEGRPQLPPSNISSSTTSKMLSHGTKPSSMPQRPFAGNRFFRGESPAGSSTGDSSSGRSPFTPREGSDIGARSKEDASDVGSTLKARGHAKKSSVTFEDQLPARGRERAKTELTSEEKTRERRRSEAKAAIELGKIVNGRGPLVHNDDDDDDMRLRGRNPTINVTMENGMPGMMTGWPAWQQPIAPMAPPRFGNDPSYLAAHQRALLCAKQAYQMAVAQQAMQMAGEEWERGSSMGFGSGGSAYGGSVYGGGSGGSVYGGGSAYGGMGGGASMAPMGMMGMPNMGMLMPPNQWAGSSIAFPGTASVYGGIGSSQSEYGGGGGWGTRSVYGDSFGPASSRTSHIGNGGASSATSAYGGGARPRARTGVSPPSTSSSRLPGKSAAQGRPGPPSSWKSGR